MVMVKARNRDAAFPIKCGSLSRCECIFKRLQLVVGCFLRAFCRGVAEMFRKPSVRWPAATSNGVGRHWLMSRRKYSTLPIYSTLLVVSCEPLFQPYYTRWLTTALYNFSIENISFIVVLLLCSTNGCLLKDLNSITTWKGSVQWSERITAIYI